VVGLAKEKVEKMAEIAASVAVHNSGINLKEEDL